MIRASNTRWSNLRMQNDSQSRSVSPEALQREHESVNPRPGPIALAAGIVVLFMAGCLGLIWFSMKAADRYRPGDGRVMERGIITAPNAEMLRRFPGPNLQVSPPADLVSFRSREDVQLNSYGWVDRSNGIVRIPVARAMEL